MEDGEPGDSSNPTAPTISQRRQSLPVYATKPFNKQTVNRPPMPPASPEVISSLISSLSAISTPARSHFDNLPKIGSFTAPPSPTFQQVDFIEDGLTSKFGDGFGVDYGAYKTPTESNGQSYLHPDDAAVSPVVRMSKPPPSPRSPRSAHSRRSSRSFQTDSAPRGSHNSLKTGQDDLASYGVVRSESAPRLSTASIASSSSGGIKCLKNLGLTKRSSREFTKDHETDRLSVGNGSWLNRSRSRLSLRSVQSMAELTEERHDNSPREAEKIEPHEARRDSAPNIKTCQSPVDSPGGIGNSRIIPNRESSLRHSYAGTSSRKRRSARYSGYSGRDFAIDRNIAEINPEDDQVTRRIQEIKAHQKVIKDRMVVDDRPQAEAFNTRSRGANRLQTSTSFTHSETVFQSINAGLDIVEVEHSAPSPAVLTRRTLQKDMPLASRTTNIQPAAGKQDLSGKPPKTHEQAKDHRFSNPVKSSDPKKHRRILSDSSTPIPRSSSIEFDGRPSGEDMIEAAVESYVTSPRLTQKVPHPQTGRIIAFSDVGDPNGHVVFCCVGMGLTRYLTAFYDELARTLKLRLITLDRPGVGESEPCLDGTGTPLSWPDDLAIICNYLKITKFSMLAHSAGAIYALATALRMPQHIRGRIHLLATWIPPSQMSGIGSQKDPLPAKSLPYSQRILRALPTPILKVANSSFMTATSASITSSLPRSSQRMKRRNTVGKPTPNDNGTSSETSKDKPSSMFLPKNSYRRPSVTSSTAVNNPGTNATEAALISETASMNQETQSDYDNRLTHMIWELATTNANPAIDLLICLERRHTIGFRYVDINRAVVLHHGSRDTRVPVDNVRWLGKTMRRCEVRVLEGEGHGLMASATVMGNVLMEIAKEWEDWTTVVQGRRDGKNDTPNHSLLNFTSPLFGWLDLAERKQFLINAQIDNLISNARLAQDQAFYRQTVEVLNSKTGHKYDEGDPFKMLKPGSVRPDNKPTADTGLETPDVLPGGELVPDSKPGEISIAGRKKMPAPNSKTEDTEEEIEIKTELNSILKRSPIIIFSKSYCPYSAKAKHILLEMYEVVPAPFVVELDQHPLGQKLQDLLGSSTGRRTVPNVLINGKSIGGGDDIEELDAANDLTTKIKALGGKQIMAISRKEEKQL
ncbi:hypothetical protein FQN57_001031 [Myotisia sp. PD_48]|nr:hypothetical protein FQN57_001031 [Myotisia sp. PD_48]